MDRPAGNTSENATPLKEALALVLVMLKASVDVTFSAIGVGEKLFVRVGGSGLRQPLKVMLSRYIDAVVLPLVSAWIVNLVVLVPLDVAVAVAPVWNEPFAAPIVAAKENAPPSALE
jgi:hypothetical protein